MANKSSQKSGKKEKQKPLTSQPKDERNYTRPPDKGEKYTDDG